MAIMSGFQPEDRSSILLRRSNIVYEHFPWEFMDFETFVTTYEDRKYSEIKNLCLVLQSVKESYNWKQVIKLWKKVYNFLLKRNQTVKFIVNDQFDLPAVDLLKCRFRKDINVVNFFLIDAVYRSKYTKIDINPSWNYRAKKGLCLTGKPDKLNRIGLLRELERIGMLDSLVYSFFPDKIIDREEAEHAYNLMARPRTKYSFRRFCKLFPNNPDGITTAPGAFPNHYSGYPYNVDLYKNTRFSIIPETETEKDIGVPWITEKTYKTIMNNHPFLIAGQRGSLAHLRSYGFKTFENYLDFNYDNISDPVQRLRAVASLSRCFLKDDHIEEIQQDTEYNRKLMFQIADETWRTQEYFQSERDFHSFHLHGGFQIDDESILDLSKYR